MATPQPLEAEAKRELLRNGCSRVGIISTVGPKGVNLMTAEWTYLVALRPLHFAIGLGLGTYSVELIRARGEFGLTLCDSSLAPVADFVGSFSGAEIDKSQVSGVDLRAPAVTGTPTVRGGYLNAECRVVSVVELPDYALIIGEAVSTVTDTAARSDPLVRNGRLYRLGEEVCSLVVTASATRIDGGRIRVCATAQGADRERLAPWSITLSSTGRLLYTGKACHTLDTVIEVPESGAPGDYLVIDRPDCRPANAALPQIEAGE